MSSVYFAAKAKTSQSKLKRSLSDADDDFGIFQPLSIGDSTEEGGESPCQVGGAEERQDFFDFFVACAMKQSKKPKPRRTKRQKQGPVPRSKKGKRKVGWRAAKDQAVFQREEDRSQKKSLFGWQSNILSKLLNLYSVRDRLCMPYYLTANIDLKAAGQRCLKALYLCVGHANKGKRSKTSQDSEWKYNVVFGEGPEKNKPF